MWFLIALPHPAASKEGQNTQDGRINSTCISHGFLLIGNRHYEQAQEIESFTNFAILPPSHQSMLPGEEEGPSPASG